MNPTFAACIDTLHQYGATPDELDLLAVVEYVNDEHQPVGGACETCCCAWPCSTWTALELATVEWLIKRSTAVARRRSKSSENASNGKAA